MTTNTPSHANSPKPEGSKHTTASSSTTSFTPEMRDRQARGKNPYSSDSDDSDWAPVPVTSMVTGTGTGTGAATAGTGATGTAGATGTVGATGTGTGTGDGDKSKSAGPRRVGASSRKRDEPFVVYDRRRIAAQILDSSELLMMAAVRDDESIPATRLKYTRVLCGVEEPNTTSTRPGAARALTAEQQRKRSNLEQGKAQEQRGASGKGGEI